MAVMSRRRNLFLFDAKPEYALHRCECSVRCCGTHCESDMAEGFEGAQAARKHVVLLHGEPLLSEGGIGFAHRDYQPNEPVHSLCDFALCSHS